MSLSTHTEDRTLRHSSTALHQQNLNDNTNYHSYPQPLVYQHDLPIISSAPERYHSVQPQRFQQYSSIGRSLLQSDYRAGQERQLDYPSHNSHYLTHGRNLWTQASPAWPTDFADAYMSGATMGYSAVAPVSGLKRQRSHHRTPSASTEGSSGPDSPYTFSSSNPQIANTDLAPEYQQSFEKTTFLTPDYLPRAVATSMKAPAFGSHNLEDLPTPGSAGTMSATENDTPATPVEEVETKKPAFRAFPQLQLTRTESAAFQDELYNPADFRAVTKQPAKQVQPLNTHRSLIEKRLQAAEDERSQSPSLSRERSPFREGSSLSERQPFISPQGPMNHAAKRRQRIEEDQESQNALRRPQLQREPTKTISPKDALLDYTGETDQPLFQDTIPGGYQQHNGATNELLKNAFLAQQNPTFTLPPSNSQTSMAGFRASSTADYTNGNYNFVAPAIPTNVAAAAAMPMPFQINNYLAPAYTTETTPDFPAHLTSMESSISEGPPMSSQESMIQRPADTRAHTGTYTCTYHGCTQRFESQPLLQRHKRDYHRSQQQQRDSLSVEPSSTSPRSTASPGPTGSGLTSAQILARNSQAGPHKCTRINPSTGKPCNTIFSRPYDLTRHEDTIHNGRKQKVRCPYCREEKTFSRNDALTRHLRVVHPDVESMGKRGRRGD